MPRSATFLRATLLIPWLLALVAVAFQAHRITSQPKEYRAIGKFHMKESPSLVLNYSFYATQIEIFESAGLRRRAIEHVRVLHPEWKEIDVEIRATYTKGTTSFTIAATGKEPEYTRVFLEATLDEYVKWAKEMVQNLDSTPGTVQRPDVAVEVIPDLWVPLTVWALIGGGVGFVLKHLIAVIVLRIKGGQSKVLPNPQ